MGCGVSTSVVRMGSHGRDGVVYCVVKSGWGESFAPKAPGGGPIRHIRRGQAGGRSPGVGSEQAPHPPRRRCPPNKQSLHGDGKCCSSGQAEDPGRGAFGGHLPNNPCPTRGAWLAGNSSGGSTKFCSARRPVNACTQHLHSHVHGLRTCNHAQWHWPPAAGGAGASQTGTRGPAGAHAQRPTRRTHAMYSPKTGMQQCPGGMHGSTLPANCADMCTPDQLVCFVSVGKSCCALPPHPCVSANQPATVL
jgi:hypothetical protein